MKYRALGNTGMEVSELSFGTWAVGGDWGNTQDDEALRALHVAMDAGVNSFDTADVYGSGHSEELLARATKGKESEIFIATKFCRRGDINDPATYSEASVRRFLEEGRNRWRRFFRDPRRKGSASSRPSPYERPVDREIQAQ